MNRLIGWIDARFPLISFWEEHVSRYYAPKNFNFWYYFGSHRAADAGDPDRLRHLADHVLHADRGPSAFASVEYDHARRAQWGWFIRYMHTTGASFFFLAVYLHMFRATHVRIVQETRELIWIIGMLIYRHPDGGGVLPAICCRGARCPTGAPR